MAKVLGKKIEEHKVFFAKLPQMMNLLENLKRTGEIECISPEQLECIEIRLSTVTPRAAQRKVRLQYLEHKVTLFVKSLQYYS